MSKIRLAILALFFGSSLCFAQEQVTITTYYPSPYGVYNSLLARKMAVGDTNGDGQLDSNDAPASNDDLLVKGNVGIGVTAPTAAAAPNGATAGNLDANDVWLRGANAGAGRWASQGATVSPEFSLDYSYWAGSETKSSNIGTWDYCALTYHYIIKQDNENENSSCYVYQKANGTWIMQLTGNDSGVRANCKARCMRW